MRVVGAGLEGSAAAFLSFLWTCVLIQLDKRKKHTHTPQREDKELSGVAGMGEWGWGILSTGHWRCLELPGGRGRCCLYARLSSCPVWGVTLSSQGLNAKHHRCMV